MMEADRFQFVMNWGKVGGLLIMDMTPFVNAADRRKLPNDEE